ncbi:MAG: Co2+/Mg2+ efflux protein ApaG [Chitinophagales bacterium]|nr:Co2+/Mg2+ efflux protein ApaG [Chitinophagales bacterium]
MISAITRGIKVLVESFYQVDYSLPAKSEFMFAYRITIVNESDKAVKLMRRHWFIMESDSMIRQVEGEGVVGQQPILTPGESYQYISGCGLKSEIGKMYGTYLFQRLQDGKLFYATIPEFKLIASDKLN